MLERARGIVIGFGLTAVSLAGGTSLAGQIHEGPAQGTSDAGQIVSTSSFPLQPPAGVAAPRPRPDHEVRLLPDPADLRPPLAPLGWNEQDDPSFYLPGGPTAAPGVLRDFQGITETQFIPPDPIVAAGPGHLLALVNSDFAIFSKDGVNEQQVAASSWFDNVLPGGGPFDPKVIYDHFADRFVMVWLDLSFNDSTSHILVSVSDDSDPNGDWCNWALRGDLAGATPDSSWSDYQGLGFDEDAIYIVPNQFTFPNASGSLSFKYVKLRILPKSTLYDPACPAVTWTDFWNLREPDGNNRIFTVRPAVTFGSPGVEYLINDSPFGTGTFMTLWSLTNPLDPSPTLTAQNVATTTRQPPPNADQQGGSSTLVDVGGPRVRNLVYRDGSVWTAHSVADDSGDFARARYVRIDVAGPTVLEDVAFGRDGCWLYYPAVTADVNSNMFMVYNQSCTDEFIGIRQTGRRPSDSELQPSAELKAGEANYVVAPGGRNRWGDYNGIAVDPADPTRVWMFAEYAASPEDTWGTWFGEAIARGLGDVNDDGEVNVGDVVLLVDIILERVEPDPTTAILADCTGDIALNIGDVVCLVDLILGGSASAIAASLAPGSEGPGRAVARLRVEPVERDELERTLLLELDLGPGVAGLQARIAYEPDRVRLGQPQPTDLTRGFELAARDRSGILDVLLYDLAGKSVAAGRGPVLRIPVRAVAGELRGEDLGLELREVLLADKRGGVRPAEIVAADLTLLPSKFELGNPYPNPLRPDGRSAVLELKIPEPATPALSGGEGGRRGDGSVRVQVDVFNVRGQRVRRLVDTFLPPGRHSVEWDGRTDRGGVVGAGLYVVRVQAGSFGATRKLIVSNR